MVTLLNALGRLKKQRTAQNASWILGGQTLNFFIQALYFVLLARLLGAGQYGVFAGAFALVSIVTPYSALGAGMLFMRYAPKNRSLAPIYWGNSLAITTAVTLVLSIALAGFGPFFTHIENRPLFVTLVVANCLLSQIVVIGGFIFQSYEKMRFTAALTLLSNLARLTVLGVMKLIWHHATALQWSLGLLAGTALAASWSLWLVYKEIGKPSLDIALALRRVTEGVGYSFAGSTQALYNDVDKTLLSHYGMTEQNGPYTLAYRMIDFATSPIVSIDAVTLPRYFRHGYEKIGEVIRLAKKSLRTVSYFGVAIAVAILLVAPLIPLVVGTGFSAVVTALRLLCWLPLLRGAHRIAGGALTGMGFQIARTSSQVSVAILNLLLNIWLIPAHGWLGAAWSSLASDGLLAALNLLILIAVAKHWIKRAPTRPITAETPPPETDVRINGR